MKKLALVILLATLVASCLVMSACDTNGSTPDHLCEFGEWTVTEQPTCTEVGERERYCSCGEKQTSSLAATGHSYTHVVTDPTCTEQGFTTHTCAGCGDSYVDTYVKVTDHSYTAAVTPPTCTEKGFTTHTCHCGDSYVDTYVDALGHTEGEVFVENKVDATCTTDGSYDNVVYCIACNAELSRETKTIEAGHSYSAVVTPPTCTEQGFTTHTCACGDSYVDAYVDALDHDEIGHIAQAPTCTEIGWDAYVTCSRCNYSTYNEIPAIGHSHSSVVTPPTCAEKGFTTHTCHCGDSYVDTYVDATGHADDQWIVDIEPDCTTDGSKHQICATCGATIKTETIDALGHDTIDHTAQAPTCANVGWDEYVTCKRNGCDYSTYNESPATGNHTWDNGKITTQPTCTEEGEKTFTCTSCNTAIKTEKVETNEHKYKTEWSTDDNYHWHDSECCDLISHYGYHEVGLSENCLSCNKKLPATSGVMYDIVLGGGYAEVIGYFGSATNIIIADTYQGYPVKNIYSNAFNGANITSVYIPNSIVSIGEKAFYNCSSLKQVNIPESITSLEYGAFYGCISLSLIEFDAVNLADLSVDNYVFAKAGSKSGSELKVIISNKIKKIPDYLFCPEDNSNSVAANVKSLIFEEGSICETIGTCSFARISITELNLPESVKDIQYGAFEYCPFRTLTLPSNLKSIGKWAFAAGSNYTLTSIIIPEGVKSIGDEAFRCNYALETVSIPNSLENWGSSVFKYCDKLTYNLSNYCNYLGNQTSPYLVLVGVTIQNLTQYSIHPNTKFIDDSAFNNCSRLTTVSLPDNVIIIGSNAFLNCTALTSITIPESVIKIKQTAFGGCSALTNIYFNAIDCDVEYRIFDNCGTSENGIYVSIGSKVTSISDNMFSNLTSLKSVSFAYNSECSYIGERAFYNCSSLQSINIPSGVTIIKDETFMGCTSLLSVTFLSENQLLCIGAKAFYNCSSLSTINIPETLTELGAKAFYGCSSLKEIHVPIGVTYIYDKTFYGCDSLEQITLPFVGESKDAIGYKAVLGYAFGYKISSSADANLIWQYREYKSSSGSYTYYDYYNYYIPSTLKTVTILGGKISTDAFNNCTQITSIMFGDYISNVYSTFSSCDKLKYNTYSNCNYLGTSDNPYFVLVSVQNTTSTGYTINNNTKHIVNEAFYGCSYVKSITIPNGVISIGSKAFYNCSALTTVSIPNGLISIGYSAFSACSSLQSIIIPDGVISIESNAFYNCSALTTVSIPNSLQYLGDDVFYGCKKLTSTYLGNEENPYLILMNGSNDSVVEINKDTKFINSRAFSSKYSLEEVILPDGLISIGGSAFASCKSLQSIIIPDSVTYLGSFVFHGCSALTNVYYVGTEEQWNNIEISSNNNELTNATIHFNYIGEEN